MERRHRSEHKRQWARAGYVASQCCPGGTVTQVSDRGFHVRSPDEVIPKFVPWPVRMTDDGLFGRVAGPE